MVKTRVPTALPDDNTTQVHIDSAVPEPIESAPTQAAPTKEYVAAPRACAAALTRPYTENQAAPEPIEREPTQVWVRGWAVMQEVLGESTIRVQPPHSAETMRMTFSYEEAVPEPIEEPLETKFAALCRLVHLAEIYGWNPIMTADGRHTKYDGNRIGTEIDVMRTDPTGVGYPTAIKLVISDWPEFKRWFRARLADGFRGLHPLADEHREFFAHFAETLDHHQPSKGGGQHIVITNL